MAGTGGYSTTGFPVATSDQVGPQQLISVDTENPNGSSPQTIAAPVWAIQGQTKVNDGLTAHSGGTQAAALLLTHGLNNVTTVAAGADSVKLPPAVLGKIVYVMNSAAANSMQVFGGGTSTINGVATATGVAQAAGKGAVYICISGDGTDVAGAWMRVLGA